MTPIQLLEDTKRRFMVLYHDDPEDLRRLLHQALAKFQDKAGYIAEFWTWDSTIEVPDGFQAVASVSDKRGRYVPWRMCPASNGKAIVLAPLDKNESPYCLYYFLNLRKWPHEKDLPGDVPPLLEDYLEALIALQNTERQRNAMNLTGQMTQDLPPVSELKQRVREIEMEMEDSKNIIVPASYF